MRGINWPRIFHSSSGPAVSDDSHSIFSSIPLFARRRADSIKYRPVIEKQAEPQTGDPEPKFLSILYIYREKNGKLYGISALVNGVRNLSVLNNFFWDESGLKNLLMLIVLFKNLQIIIRPDFGIMALLETEIRYQINNLLR